MTVRLRALVPAMTPTPSASLPDALARVGVQRVLLEALPAGVSVQAHKDADGVHVFGDAPAALVDIVAGLHLDEAIVEALVTDEGAVWLTDLLFADGDDLTDTPLIDRLDRLGEVAPASVMPERVVAEFPALADAFARHVAERGGRQVGVRDPGSRWTPGPAGDAWLVLAD